MRNITTILFLLFFYGMLHLQAQSLGSVAGAKPLNMPAKYATPNGEVLEKSGKTRPGYAWVVFSDRTNNPTYTDKEGGNEYKRMNFMESFWVIDESNTHVRIVKYNLSAYSNNSFNTDAVDYGWAPKNKMLLWDSGLISPENGFTNKALIHHRAEALENDVKVRDKAGEKNVILYDTPTRDEKFENSNDIRLSQFLYIFKKEGDFFLVGPASALRGKYHTTDKKTLVTGWIPKEASVEWAHRLCLEPNWEPEAVQERQNTRTQVGIAYDKNDAISIASGKEASPSTFFWQSGDNATEQRRPEYNRLPVFSHSNDNGQMILSTGNATTIFDKNGRSVMNLNEQDNIEYGRGVAIEEYRKMNIVFVIDGTSTVREYYERIASALKKTIDKFQNNTINKYSLGVVMYRDYSEAQCSTGDRTLSTLKLTNNESQVISFIKDMVSEAKECATDPNKEKALFYGLKVAADMFSPFPNQRNVLIVIGATGNESTDSKGYSLNTLGDALSGVQCNIMTFQVKNVAGDQAFDRFSDQTDNLIKNVYTQVSKKIGSQTNRTFNPNYMYDNGAFVLKNAPISATSIAAEQGVPMNEGKLESELINLIENITQRTEDDIAGANQITNGNVIKDVKISEGAYLILANMIKLGKVKPDLLQKAEASNIQFFFEGFTPYKKQNLKYPLYKYEIFVSINEVAALKLVMSKLFTGSNQGGLRENIVNAYKEILSTYYGPTEVRDMMNSKSAGEVLALVTGLPSQSDLMTRYKINDYLDEKVVTEDKLQEIVDYIRSKYEDMSKIVGSKEAILRVNDETYHYLPQDVFP